MSAAIRSADWVGVDAATSALRSELRSIVVNRMDENIFANRLGDEIIHPGIEAGLDIVCKGIGGEGNDRQSGQFLAPG
jgi:hypothetical protein